MTLAFIRFHPDDLRLIKTIIFTSGNTNFGPFCQEKGYAKGSARPEKLSDGSVLRLIDSKQDFI